MPVRLGFIGCGEAAALHWETFATIEEARPVAFCDVEGPRAAAAARRFGGQAYATPQAMFERETLDAVYVCLPSHARGDAELLTARAGCALFAETPVSFALKTAERIAVALENAKVVAAVGYQWRYSDPVARLHKMLSTRGAAPPTLLTGHWRGSMPSGVGERRAPPSGGLAVEQGTHLCDLARVLGGEVKRVSAIVPKLRANQTVKDALPSDSVGVLLEFVSGTIGTLTLTSVLEGIHEEALSLAARDTLYELDSHALTVRTAEETRTFLHQSDARTEMNRAFIQAVKTGRRGGLKSTYPDALKTLRLTLAIQHAAKSGKPVTV